jgi:hypothetical protein
VQRARTGVLQQLRQVRARGARRRRRAVRHGSALRLRLRVVASAAAASAHLRARAQLGRAARLVVAPVVGGELRRLLRLARRKRCAGGAAPRRPGEAAPRRPAAARPARSAAAAQRRAQRCSSSAGAAAHATQTSEKRQAHAPPHLLRCEERNLLRAASLALPSGASIAGCARLRAAGGAWRERRKHSAQRASAQRASARCHALPAAPRSSALQRHPRD